MAIHPLTELLEHELKISMGCTEPAALALAGARASNLLICLPEIIEITVSHDIVKNVMSVRIPHCESYGVEIAVCIGIVSKKIDLGLNILSELSDDIVTKAEKLLQRTRLKIIYDIKELYIKIRIATDSHEAVCLVQNQHDHITLLSLDDITFIKDTDYSGFIQNQIVPHDVYPQLSLDLIVEYALKVPLVELEFLVSAAVSNLSIAKKSMEKSYGLGVGRLCMDDLRQEPKTFTEAIYHGAAWAAGAADARMAGCSMPVVINSGSGNQGITCTIPLLIIADFLAIDNNLKARSLAVSNLMAISLTVLKNRLSALCGAFTAAIGLSCGLVFMQGGRTEEMAMAIDNMIGNLTGIICDGAKDTCALKIQSCVIAAGLCSRMACKGVSPAKTSGIIGKDNRKTLYHLARIINEGMNTTDHIIMDIMLNKQKSV